MEEEKQPLREATKQVEEIEEDTTVKEEAPPKSSAGGRGWGGWGFSAFSVLSDLQKAAEEISRNAAAVAQTAAKSIVDLKNEDGHEEASKEKEAKDSAAEDEREDENDKLRKSALDKLEKASEDSVFGQGLKVLDTSVENIASGAWKALGSALRGGSDFVHKLENSAANIAETIQHQGIPAAAGSVAPSLLERGKALTTKGMEVLELVGRETMDLLITETGIEVEKTSNESERHVGEDQLDEEVTFDRCFYIYGGPEQLEELEALSNHYTLLYNRRKGKLSQDQKSVYDGKLKQVQQIFSLSNEVEGNSLKSDKGKKLEVGEEGIDEIKSLYDSSVSKAAEMAAGFGSSLAELAVPEIMQRTIDRLESLHSEGVHRLSETCYFAVSQLLMLGKSIITNANKVDDDGYDGEDGVEIQWPEDSVEKAEIIRLKALSMAGYVDALSNSFITGLSDVSKAYQAAMSTAPTDSHKGPPQTSIQDKANAFSEHLQADRTTAFCKIQDGLQYLSYLVLSNSMPSA